MALYSTLYCTFTLHGTALHCTALHCTHWTALHCTALHCTALHCAALRTVSWRIQWYSGFKHLHLHLRLLLMIFIINKKSMKLHYDKLHTIQPTQQLHNNVHGNLRCYTRVVHNKIDVAKWCSQCQNIWTTSWRQNIFYIWVFFN